MTTLKRTGFSQYVKQTGTAAITRMMAGLNALKEATRSAEARRQLGRDIRRSAAQASLSGHRLVRELLGRNILAGESARDVMDVRRAIRSGYLVIILAFGSFFIWAAFAPLAKGTHAFGAISVEGNRKTIQHLEGGIIQEIAVKDGDFVKDGQVLIRLDDTRAKANYDIHHRRYVELLATEARLLAEKDGAEDIVIGDALQQNRDDAEVENTIIAQQQLFKARQEELANQKEILRQRMTQLQDQISGMQGQKESIEEQMVLIEDELKGLRKLLAKGFSSRTRVLALERAAADLKGEVARLVAEISKAQVQIGQTEIEIIQFQQNFRSKVIDELREVRAAIADILPRMQAAQDTLERTIVRSPVDGQVVGLNVHTIGGVIAPGGSFVSVVPDNEKLVVDARISPIDIDSVHKGMEAEIRLPGLSLRTAPLLRGYIKTLSADALEMRDGEQYYRAVVEVPAEEMAVLGDTVLIPGMPAEVLIKAGERTALDYLISPWTKIMRTAMREE